MLVRKDKEMTVNIPNNDLTRIFVELYAERVAIMEIDGGVENAERAAYDDVLKTLRGQAPQSVEQFPSLEFCKTAPQHI